MKAQRWIQFKKYRNLLVQCSSKTNFYKKFFNDNKRNLKNIWNGIREIVGGKLLKMQSQIFQIITKYNLRVIMIFPIPLMITLALLQKKQKQKFLKPTETIESFFLVKI